MSFFSRIFRYARRLLLGNFDEYLKSCRGIIHIGANSGQERDSYNALGLNVIWVEPIPAIYDALSKNIASFSKQRAIRALISDQDDQDLVLNIANNEGASSSIFEIGELHHLWPEIHYVDRLTLKSVTLPTLVAREKIDLSAFDALLLDTQGAEFAILTGAKHMLRHFRYIQVEAADFEAYAGATGRHEITRLLVDLGFELKREQVLAKDSRTGAYFDLLFERQ